MSVGPLDVLGAEDENEMVYENAIVQKIRNTIHDRVGTEIPRDISGMKNIKPVPPKKYGGRDDIESFESWLADVLRWLRVAGVTGPEKDQLRIDLCGTTLKGLAADWFHLEVESFDRKVRHWTFTELIVAMYERFIHEVTAQNATTKFYDAKYSKSKGVLAFYNDLERYAGRMVARPDDYTFKRQLLRGLPQDMVEVLIKTRRVTAEHTSLPRLLQEAKSMESAFQAVDQHKRDRQTASHDHSGHVVVATVPQKSEKTARSKTSHTLEEESSIPNVVPTKGDYESRPQQNERTTPLEQSSSQLHRSGSSLPPENSSSGPSRRPGPSASSSQTKTAKPIGSSSSNKVTCFTCGEEGHYSNSCPNNDPKVYTMRVTDTEDERERESHDEQETQDVGELLGSQYTSEEEADYGIENESDDPQVYGLRVLEEIEERPSVSLRTMTTLEETPQKAMRSELKRIEGRREITMRPINENEETARNTIIDGMKAYAQFDPGGKIDAVNSRSRVERNLALDWPIDTKVEVEARESTKFR